MNEILDLSFSSQSCVDNTMSMSVDDGKFPPWRRDVSPLLLLTSEPNPHFHSGLNYVGALKTSTLSSNRSDLRKKSPRSNSQHCSINNSHQKKNHQKILRDWSKLKAEIPPSKLFNPRYRLHPQTSPNIPTDCMLCFQYTIRRQKSSLPRSRHTGGKHLS
jgi:hypothetical protein